MGRLKVFGWQHAEFRDVTRGEHMATTPSLKKMEKFLIEDDFITQGNILYLLFMRFSVLKSRSSENLQ